ncbi:phosphotransferase [Halalkalibacter flavus]|uniref:phosphotransferase n=1 Tax=Halalkalibacter flavus TaxID=3090668 RepID=UPI002FCB9DF8
MSKNGAVELAWKLMKQRRWEEASKQLEEIINENEGLVPLKAYLGLGRAYREQYLFQQAEEILDKGKTKYLENHEYLIELAKVSMDKKEWLNAVARWDEAIDRIKDQVKPPTIYIGLEKAFRELGLLYHAEITAKEGVQQHPNNAKLLVCYAQLLMRKKKWDEAITYWLKLLEIKDYSMSFDHYQKIAKCYIQTGCTDSVDYYIRLGLKTVFGLNVRKELKRVKSSINKEFDKIDSNFTYLGGAHNLAIIEHSCQTEKGTKEYITKICDSKKERNSIKNEKLFNKSIREKYQILKTISPELINITKSQNRTVSFITFEKVESIAVEEDINKIVNLSNVISSINPSEYANSIKPPNFFSKDTKLFFRYFTTIHEETSNRKVFRWLKRKLKSLECDSKEIKIIKQLESTIVKNKLFEQIDPNKNYSFFHGDFKSDNILNSKELDTNYIIDWTNYNIGPKGLDMTIYFNDRDMAFSEIDTNYLSNEKTNLNVLEKVVMIYSLIVYRFTKVDRKRYKEDHIDFIQPAVRKMEQLLLDR